MKQELEWHKNCLENRSAFLDRKNAELIRLKIEIDAEQTLTDLYSAQIELAEKEGKDGFDSDIYAIRRLCV